MTGERRRITIRLHDLLGLILGSAQVIICWSLFCGVLLFSYKEIFKRPVFTAETSVYVLSRTPDSDYGRLDVSDLEVSSQMASDAVNLLSSRQAAEKVLVNLRGDAAPLQLMSSADLLDMVRIQKKEDSLEVVFTVTGPDPYAVCDIANTYRETAIRELNSRLMAKGVQTIKEAVIPLEPSGRPPVLYGLAGLFLGLISSVGLIVLVYIVRYAERSEEDVGEI